MLNGFAYARGRWHEGSPFHPTQRFCRHYISNSDPTQPRAPAWETMRQQTRTRVGRFRLQRIVRLGGASTSKPRLQITTWLLGFLSSKSGWIVSIFRYQISEGPSARLGNCAGGVCLVIGCRTLGGVPSTSPNSGSPTGLFLHLPFFSWRSQRDDPDFLSSIH